MPRLRIEEFRQQLERVIPPDDEVVVLFSGIWSFGHRFGMPPERLADELLKALMDYLGPERTLVLPAYTSDFPRSRVYDLVRTKPYTGVLPTTFLTYPNVRRTGQPIDSYAVSGPRSEEVLARPCTTVWGDDSVLGFFGETNARMVILGVPWHDSCAYCHRTEAVFGVPYRYHKRFTGTFMIDGVEHGECEETLYIPPWDVEARLNYKPIHDVLVERRLVLQSSLPDIILESSSAEDILRIGLELLRADPYAFVSNRSEVESWVNEGKDREMARLSPEQRPQTGPTLQDRGAVSSGPMTT